MVIVKCTECGKEFYAKTKMKKFCPTCLGEHEDRCLKRTMAVYTGVKKMKQQKSRKTKATRIKFDPDCIHCCSKSDRIIVWRGQPRIG